MLDKLEVKEWLKLNAELQKKKNKLRKILKSRGILKREGQNNYDNYKYFSEAQYKLLFNDLFADCNLELKFSELAYDTFEGTGKNANGRMPRIKFTLFDVDTGFYEDTVITGEGMDKGDKAGYKAYTGALKYYLADTFMVATGDDPETESPGWNMNKVKPEFATASQVEYIRKNCTPDQIGLLLGSKGVTKLEELSERDAASICIKLNKRITKEMEAKNA